MSLLPYDFEDEFFDRLLSPRSRTKNTFFSPRVDITENNRAFLVTAELPGIKKDDIHIHLEDGLLSIEAEMKDESKEEKDGKVVRQERRYGKYSRSFNVGKNIQESDIAASYTDGILELTLPKPAPVPPARRKISVS